MRTTVTIDDALLARAKKASAERKCSLGELIEEGLRSTLAERSPRAKDGSLKPFKIFNGTGPRPGIDLNSGSGILNVMEE